MVIKGVIDVKDNISVGDIIGYKTVLSGRYVIYARVGTLMEVKDSIYTAAEKGHLVLELECVDAAENMKLKREIVKLNDIEIVALYKECVVVSTVKFSSPAIKKE